MDAGCGMLCEWTLNPPAEALPIVSIVVLFSGLPVGILTTNLVKPKKTYNGDYLDLLNPTVM